MPVAEFAYDGGGDRVQQVNYNGDTPVTTTYANDPLGMTQVLLANDGVTQVANLYGLDLISQDDGTTTRTLLTDGLGSVRQEMADGSVQTTTTYDPYGKLLAQSGTSGTVYGYTGEQEDAATGLVYLRARYYNPSLHQFMSRDPFPGYTSMPASLNGYNYVHGNSVNYTDPSSYCIELVSGAICVGVGVIVVGGVAIIGGTAIVVNNIVNDRPPLDFSGVYLPPAPDWMVDNFYVLDDLQQWIESYPLLENSAPYFGSFPLQQQQLNNPTGLTFGIRVNNTHFGLFFAHF